MGTTGRKRVGLALSGGVARGPAHLGVLTVLEREGIPIDCVAGTSAGAVVGALYCAGVGVERALEMLAHFGWGQIASAVWPSRGFVSFDRMERWLTELIGDVRFDELRCPLAVAATDLKTGEAVVLCEGRVAPAVHASSAVPGFVVPVELEGRLLGDGGASENMPVAAARALGAEVVIGVDLFPIAMRRRWGPFGFGFAALENLIRRSGGGLTDADCLIAPEVAGTSYLRFSQAMEMVALGARSTETGLPAIRAAVFGEIAAHSSAKSC
jgi:NTE family protein